MTDDALHAHSGGFDAQTWSALCAALSCPSGDTDVVVSEALLDAAARVGVKELVRAAAGAPALEPHVATHTASAHATLHIVHDALTATRVRHVFFKGCFADAVLFGARGVREGNDVDVLVAPADFDAAERAINAAGFHRLDDTALTFTAKTAKAWVLEPRLPGRVPVDLHRRPINDPPFSSAAADVLHHVVTYPTVLGALPGPRVEDAIVWIAGNLAGGRFQGLLRLAHDAAAWWRRGPVDADALVARAQAWRAEAATWGLLRLLSARFGVEIAAPLFAALAPSAQVGELVEQAFGVLGAPRLPATKAEAVLLMDWPLVNRPGFIVQKAADRALHAAADRVAALVKKIRSRAATPLANVRAVSVTVTDKSRVQIPPEVLIQEIDGESVLLDLRSEKYFGLDESGTLLFTALKTTGTVQGAITAGLEAYDVQEAELRADVLELVEKLAAEGLLSVEG